MAAQSQKGSLNRLAAAWKVARLESGYSLATSIATAARYCWGLVSDSSSSERRDLHSPQTKRDMVDAREGRGSSLFRGQLSRISESRQLTVRAVANCRSSWSLIISIPRCVWATMNASELVIGEEEVFGVSLHSLESLDVKRPSQGNQRGTSRSRWFAYLP